MYIQGKRAGERLAPLEQAALAGLRHGTVTVADGVGRVYLRTTTASPGLSFTVGGALGAHTVTLWDEASNAIDTLTFRVEAKTEIRDAGGEFAGLLDMLYYTMITDGEMDAIRYQGRIYRFFVRWLRDHVHTMKGMKYFSECLKDGIDLYRNSQREDGMIWDNVYPRSAIPNDWDRRFSYDNFIRPFEDYSAEFKRIPVENDVEYLFIEGLYYTWKAVGDDGWMADTLDAAMRAMDYSVTSPYRWSEKLGLLKRGYTIDTWDFQAAEDCIVNGDPMCVDKDRTRFGVMFGDNTGYVAACGYLAEMLDRGGRADDAKRYRERGREILDRLNAISWNGRHFVHHVPESSDVQRDLGVNEASQVSLSNAYSLNRGIAHEQCVEIVKTYMNIRDHLPQGSPGEWYTIYPPFLKGFGSHNAIWQYMNGGVTPIVAGELAHGAFQHGFEDYGADILRRLAALGRGHGGRFHCVYTGASSALPERGFTTMPIRSLANVDTHGAGGPGGVPGWTGEGENDLHEMPSGRQTLAGIPFDIPDPAANGRRACVALERRQGYATLAEIPVGETAASIYFLHAASRLGPSGIAGKITLYYADGGSAVHFVKMGRDVSNWWAPSVQHGRERVAEVAWRGRNALSPNVGVVAFGLNNPHPDRLVERITLSASEDGGFWAVFGVTLCDRPVSFPIGEISFGIPDNWGAAAVVYAIVEGLAGVVDRGVAYDRAEVAPRWAAAGIDEAAATVTYPASDGYVAYKYRHDPAHKHITLELTGSGVSCACHVLLPAAAVRATAVSCDGTAWEFANSEIEGSHYVDFAVHDQAPCSVAIAYEV
jgi:hypothetical protein